MRSGRSAQGIVLWNSSAKTDVLYPEDGWQWTAASDGRITVGWIVHDYNYEDRDEWDYTANPAEYRPYVRVDGLDVSQGDLELTWFDDRRGIVVGEVVPIQGPVALPQVPETEGEGVGFGKSIAFLIQPKGLTPQTVFAELPNEMIAQIDVVAAQKWHEERPEVAAGPSRTFQARVRLGGGVPDYPEQYYFRWYFEHSGDWIPPLGEGPLSGNPLSDDGSRQVKAWDNTHRTHSETVIVEIYDDPEGANLVCRDIIHAEIK